jgi:hypothetical protein
MGKRFLVNCSTLPSREYVVLVNWPLRRIAEKPYA